MDLNRRRQVKKDEDEFCPRFQEVKKNLGERGKRGGRGIKTNFDITYIKSITIDKKTFVSSSLSL